MSFKIHCVHTAHRSHEECVSVDAPEVAIRGILWEANVAERDAILREDEDLRARWDRDVERSFAVDAESIARSLCTRACGNLVEQAAFAESHRIFNWIRAHLAIEIRKHIERLLIVGESHAVGCADI